MFVVCGEALFDVFPLGDMPEGMALDARAGGSPFNVATGLARLGQPVALLTAVSKGALGERLVRRFEQEGIDCSLVQRPDAPTTLSVVELDAEGVPSYTFYGEGGADRALMLPTDDAWSALPVRAIALGSYAAVLGHTALSLRELVEREQRRAFIAYDPNLRLKVEPDLDAWRRQLAWMLPRTQLLKASEEDLQGLTPGDTSEAFAARALSAGVSCVVVTRGAQGASAWTGAGRVDAVAAPVSTLVDTVGAGDAFQAALLTWLADRRLLMAASLRALPPARLAEALAFAARCAAVVCGRRGADMPRRTDVFVGGA